MEPIVLVDSCSYTFYRVCATTSWYQRLGKTPDLDDAEFMSKLVDQYISCMHKFTKISGVGINSMFLVRDCPIEDIWRLKHFPGYKGSRSGKPSSPYGPYIRYLNEQFDGKYHHTFRVDNAEADDVIAVLVQLFSTVYPFRRIYIVGTDSDYTQLLQYPNVLVYSPKGSKGWEQIICVDPAAQLQSKIIAGDKTDSVPRADSTSVEQVIRNSQLIDMSYIPRYIQDRVIYQLPDHIKSIVPSNFAPRNIQFGLCCINTVLRKRDIFCSRTRTLATLARTGADDLRKCSLTNCADLIKMIEWNAVNGVRVLRISSDLFPHKSNLKAPQYDFEFAKPILSQIGKLARKYKQRLIFHPGQYNVVGTPKEDVFEGTCRDLDWHAEVLDLMGCDQDSIMVVHGGGLYGDKKATIARWIKNYSRLPKRVQLRLVLENCEKCFSVGDCLEVSAATGVPVVFDTHHFDCYKQLHPSERFELPEFYMPAVIDSWHKRGMIPSFHVSEQCDGGQVGKHSDYIDSIPRYLLDVGAKHHIDIDIEAKMKEQAIFQLYTKYPDIDPRTGIVPVPVSRAERKPVKIVIGKFVFKPKPTIHITPKAAEPLTKCHQDVSKIDNLRSETKRGV